MSDRAPQGPLIIELDETPLPPAPSPADAPPPHDGPLAAEQVPVVSLGRRRWGLGTLVLALLGAFFMFWLGIVVTDFVGALFARHPWLGWAGAGLLGALMAVLALASLREVAALARLSRVEALRAEAETARDGGSPQAAEAVIAALDRLYRGRPDLEWARGRVRAAVQDAPDGDARLAIAEREYLSQLDERAQAAVTTASRNVAAATALIPLALADVLAALYCNLRMVREIAEIYGGRAGWIGSWRLMRAVAAHLVATGAVAATDDLLGPLVGGGVLGKLSRRFGEGAVNGALTARVGVSAIDVCRPLPFVDLPRPSASGLVLRALQDWRRERRNP